MTAPLRYGDDWIRRILAEVSTVAMVGASTNPVRPSYFVMAYLQRKGYRVRPINPRAAGASLLGERVYADLADLPEPPDMVDVFRRSDEAGAVVDGALAAGVGVIWLQLGVRDDAAAARAEAAGARVVMDRCPKIEYGRLYGEIGWLGVNRRVVSAKKATARQLSGARGSTSAGRDGESSR